MEEYKFTQFGTFSVFFMVPVVLFFSGKLIYSVLSPGPVMYIHIFLILVFVICLLIFYKLNITIDSTHVSFKLGTGLIGKSYRISDIKSCRPVRNSPLHGIGIRFIGNGWLYNVSGLKAVELRFYRKNSIVRIGTNKPDEISAIIQMLINKEKSPQRENLNN